MVHIENISIYVHIVHIENISIYGNKVSYYQNIKLLGVNIDSQLTFNDHISEICKKS